MALPLKERHYPKIAGLVPRTEADLSSEFLEKRSDTTIFTHVRRPKPEKPELISSYKGPLDQILLTIPSYAANRMAPTYQELLEKLPKDTNFLILTHASTKSIVEGWLSNAEAHSRASVVTAPDHLHFSVWAEDAYVVSKDTHSGETYFVEPFSFPRYGDSLIADFISNATDLRNTQAPLYFQGGNVLIGDDFFLIGADYPANSLEYVRTHLIPHPNEQPAELIARLYKEYMDVSRELLYIGSSIPVPQQEIRLITVNGEQWRELIYFGNKPGTAQPLFHIDMFLSLAGRSSSGEFRILVGDPSLAAKLLSSPLSEYSMQEIFDNIARFLSQNGFEVIRNPLPLVYVDDPIAKIRVWYFATSNNLLTETDSRGGDTVWLPTYGHGSWSELSVTDDANEQIWRDLGFNVVRLGDFHPFAENLGALHCIKKYVGRGNVTTGIS